MKKEIIKQLKSDYDELQIKPSQQLWSRIDTELDKKNNKAQKPTFHWWKYAAVIVLLISFGAFFYFENSSVLKKNITTAVPTDEIFKNDAIKNVDIENPIIENSTKEIVAKLNAKENNNEGHLNISTENVKSDPQIVKNEKEIKDEVIQIPIKEVSNSNIQQPAIAERKKVSYIKADQLLLGRELDKTREESHNNQKNFGVLDMAKIKIKSPNTFKILGFTVFSDSLETK